MSFIWFIIIGIVAGFVAGKLMRGGGFGIIVNLIVGVDVYKRQDMPRTPLGACRCAFSLRCCRRSGIARRLLPGR